MLRRVHLAEVSRGTIPYAAVVEPHTSGFYCMKHRRAKGRLRESRTLKFCDGYLLADADELAAHNRRAPGTEPGDALEE